MAARSEDPTNEIRRLQHCINDLISIFTLPAIWRGGDPAQIARTMCDALVEMLHLDVIYVRLDASAGLASVEMVATGRSRGATTQVREIGDGLNRLLGPDPIKWTPLVANLIGTGDISIVPFRLGPQSEIGTIVAGSRRTDFPGQTETLILSVAANQATIALQEARLLSEQKRLASELDQRVAQRTNELASANRALTREIAERRLIEERLRQEERDLKRSEAFLAEAQHLSLTGSFSWRVATDEITWSEQLYRIFEFEPGGTITVERIVSRVHPEDIPSLRKMIVRMRDIGGDLEFDCRLRMPDNSVRYLHMVAHGSRDQGGQPEYIGAIQDLSERRLSEEALGKARSELVRMARITSLGALTASIAHEVNQPLAGIITNASTCMRMLAADTPDVAGARETARRTIRDANRAADVVSRLRALFASKAAVSEWVDLNDAAREVVALSSSDLRGNRVILSMELADDLPPVTGDRVQLQQVILNLMLNASDAMNGVEDRPRHLTIRTERDDDDRVRLSVRDAGSGFAPHGMARLFDAFYTTKDGGMGIGLSVSRSIIESHDGRLWAVSNDGPGATFTFSIPRGTASLMSEQELPPQAQYGT
jgi:signal transduction histidine kinase